MNTNLLLQEAKAEILALKEKLDRSITWSIEDFEQQAKEIELYEGLKVGSKYDRSQFNNVLNDMISNHDSNNGITWETLLYYLDDVKKDAPYFKVDIYFTDDKSTFEGYIIKSSDEVNEDEDDQIFFYGLSEAEIKEAVKTRNPIGDFIITKYEPIYKI